MFKPGRNGTDKVKLVTSYRNAAMARNLGGLERVTSNNRNLSIHTLG
jgi:hypothetical protein